MVYDYVVVGAGLAGLLSGAMLISRGNSVAIVEKSSDIGGYLRDIIPGAPFGAHHIGIPNRAILQNFCNSLGIDIRGHIKEADNVTVVYKGRHIELSLNLENQEKQLSKMYPDQADALEAYFRYLKGFANALYDDDERKVKKYFVELSGIPFDRLLRKYFKNDDLVKLLTFIGPAYGGVCGRDSAFTFASLVVTYGFGAYYLETDWFIRQLATYILRKDENCIVTGFDADAMDYRIQEKCYVLSAADKSRVFGKKVVFAGYFVDMLKNYCERNHIESKSLNKIFRMDIGPSAYRFYARTKKHRERHEWIVMDDTPAIVSCVGGAGCDFMVTMVTDKRQAQEEFRKQVAKLICRAVDELPDDVEIFMESSPEHKFNITGNKNGAVFGWKRNSFNNMTANLVYAIDKMVKDTYVVGNWGPTFGFFGVLFTVKKFLNKQTEK